jgi:hypothetical protein
LLDRRADRVGATGFRRQLVAIQHGAAAILRSRHCRRASCDKGSRRKDASKDLLPHAIDRIPAMVNSN